MPRDEPTATPTQAYPQQDLGPDSPGGLRQGASYEAFEEDEGAFEELELPRRPRRRLLTPVPLALAAVLLCACGFIAGVLVEKGQGSSSGSTARAASALAARFRGARAGATGASGAAGAQAGGASAFAGGFTRPTTGTVAYLEGRTLYVTNAEGDTVKVTTSPATSVTKNVKSSVGAVHPGETVTITGTTGSGGAVSAEAIAVGSSGGGLASLFGGGRSGQATGGGSANVERSLFGSGG